MSKDINLFELAQNVIDANHIEEQSNTKIYKDLFATIEQIQLDDDIVQPLIAMLGLEDKSFDAIAPLVLLDINKTFHDSNNQLVMLNTFNANHISLDDLHKDVNSLIENIELLELSDTKKDFMKQIFMDLYNSISEIKGIPGSIINVPIQLCNNCAKIPTYANPTDAGMDIYLVEDVIINPGETKILPTGLKVAIPVGYELQVRPKSGRSSKSKLRIANTPGTIDAGYRDEIGIIVDNIESPIQKIYTNEVGNIIGIDYGKAYTLSKGEKIAQLVLAKIEHCAFVEINDIQTISNDGRKGGFGSTGLI